MAKSAAPETDPRGPRAAAGSYQELSSGKRGLPQKARKRKAKRCPHCGSSVLSLPCVTCEIYGKGTK